MFQRVALGMSSQNDTEGSRERADLLDNDPATVTEVVEDWRFHRCD